MSDEQKRILMRELWNIADLLRGKMNADEYKNYILGLIFYKYLSEKQEIYVNEELGLIEEAGVDYLNLNERIKDYEEIMKEIEEASFESLGFFLKPNELFNYLVKKANGEFGSDTFILEDLQNALNAIEQRVFGKESEEDFIGLFEDVDLTSPKLGKTENDKNALIVEIFKSLSKIDFDIKNPKSDILGDAYEYLIGEFAAGAGKKGGEFYTPAQVSKILAQIVTLNKDKIKSVYDPTCGSGSLLIRTKDYAKISHFYGQELNRTTYNLARMNMLLHGIHYKDFTIRQGDTLTDDKFPDLEAEAIVANPPFSAKWKSKDDPTLANDERFIPYGALAPKSAADYAFVTHMLHHLADDGVMAVVLPHGVLFRGRAEEKIRRAIIEKFNYLDAVIGLAPNLFYGTSIPACVLVFKKCRENDDILFIDASKLYEKGKNQNYLKEEHIQKIVETYKDRKEIEKFSHRASLEEIKENDFNLNIPRYVDTFEEEEPVDIAEVAKEIKELNKKEQEIDEKIAKFCEELQIDTPF
ncbi:MAG: type I restriction-modification system subunit M [Nautiliaceae bacterium]